MMITVNGKETISRTIMSSCPDLGFIGWIGFLPKHKYEVEGEQWEYELTTVNMGKDEKDRCIYSVTIHLEKPIRPIRSNDNAHP